MLWPGQDERGRHHVECPNFFSVRNYMLVSTHSAELLRVVTLPAVTVGQVDAVRRSFQCTRVANGPKEHPQPLRHLSISLQATARTLQSTPFHTKTELLHVVTASLARPVRPHMSTCRNPCAPRATPHHALPLGLLCSQPLATISCLKAAAGRVGCRTGGTRRGASARFVRAPWRLPGGA